MLQHYFIFSEEEADATETREAQTKKKWRE
jgi:hypothetical protein